MHPCNKNKYCQDIETVVNPNNLNIQNLNGISINTTTPQTIITTTTRTTTTTPFSYIPPAPLI